MTKNNFILIAGVLKEINESKQIAFTESQKELIARRFAVVLQNTNEHFDDGRFLKACGYETV